MSIDIRPARPGDAALIMFFVRELAAYEKLSDEVEATEAVIDAALFGSQPKAFCEIAERDGVPVGYAMWFLNFSSFRGRNGLYLEDVFVLPSHRGRGIGGAFLRHLAKRCIDSGWSRFEWAVLDWNETAIKFYQAQGAVLMQEWTICRVTGEALKRLAGEERVSQVP